MLRLYQHILFLPETALPALEDLQLAFLEVEEVQATWQAYEEGLKGY